MDSARGNDGYHSQDDGDYLVAPTPAPAPIAIGTDERRMHVRAYNHWASLLNGRPLPSIADLDPEGIVDFGPNSVLLDFTRGMDNPKIVYLGRALREECGLPPTVASISEVPARSLLSRLTDHYLQIIANRAPVGFEAEFINTRGNDTMYRGILMPFSSHGDTIDFVYGVINWKERVGAAQQSALESEISAAMSAPIASGASVPAFADGPSAEIAPPANDGIPLAERLHSARSSARIATEAQQRADAAFDRALSDAHDFAAAAARDPRAFDALRGNAPGSISYIVATLLFGDDRIDAVAAALDHARREGVPEGTFAQYLSAAGGLSGLGIRQG